MKSPTFYVGVAFTYKSFLLILKTNSTAIFSSIRSSQEDLLVTIKIDCLASSHLIDRWDLSDHLVPSS